MYRWIIKTAAMTMALTMMMTVSAFAGWQSNATGWRWQNPDHTYPANKWEWLDGDGDGTAECYYFDANGYMLTNTKTPDGSQVDKNGAWVANGAVQTKTVATGCTGADKELTFQSDTKSEYVVKRVSRRVHHTVEGGLNIECYDVTNLDLRNPDAIYDHAESRNFKPEFSIFVPSDIMMPDCGAIQVELDGNTVVKATPIWIECTNNNIWSADNPRTCPDYGGFAMNYEDGKYISGRLEWRSYELSDPEYALELEKELNEEAKQRALELYPDMIIIYDTCNELQ